MGCDIHWHSETKRNGQWECDQKDSFEILEDEDNYPDMADFPIRDRDYWFFGLIQPDVRTSWEWSFPERIETPADVSVEIRTKIDRWDTDGHSHGYLDRAEIKAKLEELKLYQMEHLIVPKDTGNALQHHVDRLKQCLTHMVSDVPDTDQRIVFWFDN